MLAILLALATAASAAAQPQLQDSAVPVWRRTDDGGSSEGGEGGNKIFSVPAFFVVFRETVEAVVIISVMLRMLDKMGRKDLKRNVWIGSFAGLLVATVIAVGFILAFHVFSKNAFLGDSEAIFEGCLMVAACVIITYLAASMLRMSQLREKWERKLAAEVNRIEAQETQDEADATAAVAASATESGTTLPQTPPPVPRVRGFGAKTMFWVPFTAVLREGVETVLFLGGVEAGYPTSSIPLPAVCGVICGLIFGWLLFRTGNEATLRTFLAWSTALLLLISAGLLSRGFRAFTTAGWFGPAPSEVGSSYTVDGERVPWCNRPVWNICGCCSTNNNFFSLLAALFGYSCAPTPIVVISWCGYWLLAGVFMCYRLRVACFKKVPRSGLPAPDEITMSQVVAKAAARDSEEEGGGEETQQDRTNEEIAAPKSYVTNV